MKKTEFIRGNGVTDYVVDGELHENADGASVMVESQSDLANLEGYFPGTIAYTAGFAHMWQLAADGDWEVIV